MKQDVLKPKPTPCTAQRPYQGGFTIGDKLNNVNQISSNKVLKFVGMRKTDGW